MGFSGFRIYGSVFGDIGLRVIWSHMGICKLHRDRKGSVRMENEMTKKMAHDMKIGVLQWFMRLMCCKSLNGCQRSPPKCLV